MMDDKLVKLAKKMSKVSKMSYDACPNWKEEAPLALAWLNMEITSAAVGYGLGKRTWKSNNVSIYTAMKALRAALQEGAIKITVTE